MKVRRTPLNQFPAALYDRLTGHSFLCSRGFLATWEGQGGRPVVWSVESAGVTAAILCGVEFGRFPLDRFCSLPDGLYGGFHVDPAAEGERQVLAGALLDALTHWRYARTHLFDMHARIPPHDGFLRANEETRLMPLTPDWEPPDPGLRTEERAAERRGASIVRFGADAHLGRFLELSAATYRRHGVAPRYGRNFFAALAALAEIDPRVIWRLIEHEGRMTCSHIYFVEGDTLIHWQSYFDKAYSFLKPNVYLRCVVAREFAVRGCLWLNLGATPASARGLDWFKARWGDRKVEVATWVRHQGLGSWVDRPREWPARIGSAVKSLVPAR